MKAKSLPLDVSQYIELLDKKLAEARLSTTAPPASPTVKEPPHKQIRRLEDAGYTIKFDDDYSWKDEETWLISVPGAAPGKFVVRLATDVSQGMITVYEAWNKYHDTLKTMKLRDMIMSVWKFVAGQDVNTLKWIKYKTVLEDYTMTALDTIYDKVFPGGQDDLYIPDTGNPKLRQAYCTLMIHSPFAIGALKMLKEYSTEKRRVDAFIITKKSQGGFRNLFIYMGSSATLNDKSEESEECSEVRAEPYEDLEGGTLYNCLQRLRQKLQSSLLDEDWIILSPDDWADGWIIVGHEDCSEQDKLEDRGVHRGCRYPLI